MSSNRNKFVWSYPFFYYALLKHYRKEDGVNDVAPWMSLCLLTLWCGAIQMGISFCLVANCHPDYVSFKFFSDQFDWFNSALMYIALFIPNAVFFLNNKRYEMHEKKYDLLPEKVRQRGIKISWGVMISGFIFLFFTVWQFVNSQC
jgi:hypothetical protein